MKRLQELYLHYNTIPASVFSVMSDVLKLLSGIPGLICSIVFWISITWQGEGGMVMREGGRGERREEREIFNYVIISPLHSNIPDNHLHLHPQLQLQPLSINLKQFLTPRHLLNPNPRKCWVLLVWVCFNVWLSRYLSSVLWVIETEGLLMKHPTQRAETTQPQPQPNVMILIGLIPQQISKDGFLEVLCPHDGWEVKGKITW